jgi:hypothetical protein
LLRPDYSLHRLRPVDLILPAIETSKSLRWALLRSLVLLRAAVGAASIGLGCANTERPQRAPAEIEAAASVPARTPSASHVHIPEGSFEAGTEPGRHGRVPELEPKLKRVALGPFEIDVDPFPSPAGAPLTGVSRSQARDACRERGARLCTELEWERACKGPRSNVFAWGSENNAECSSDAAGCVSAFGVRGLGSLREWTASDVETGASRGAVVRGASPSEPAERRRCARRALSDADTRSDVGFRCCHGPPNAARVETPRTGATFTQIELPLPRLAELLGADSRTRGLARELGYFEADAVRTVLDRGPRDTKGFLLTTAPLLWNPVAGSDFLVVAGRSGQATSFVVAFHVLREDDYRLASSFVMQGEPGPIVLAYNGYIRPRLHFSSCWGCPGETGKILYREPDQAVILQP